jgi:hypothetical protein
LKNQKSYFVLVLILVSSFMLAADFKPIDVTNFKNVNNDYTILEAQRIVNNMFKVADEHKSTLNNEYYAFVYQRGKAETNDSYHVGQCLFMGGGNGYFELSTLHGEEIRNTYSLEERITRLYEDGTFIHGRSLEDFGENSGGTLYGVFAMSSTLLYVGKMQLKQGEVTPVEDGKLYRNGQINSGRNQDCLGKSSVLTLIKSFVGQPGVNLLSVISQDHYKPSASDFTRIVEGSENRINAITDRYRTDLSTYFSKIDGDMSDYKSKYFEIECTTLGRLRASWMNSNYPVIEFKKPDQVVIRVGLINSRTKERFNLYFLPRDDEGYSFAIFYPDLINDPSGPPRKYDYIC